MLKKIAALLALLVAGLSSVAQTSPGLVYGQVPTPNQWNGYFSAKQDYIAPGAAGHVLTSNGTANWVSSAPAPAGNLAGGTSNAIPYQTAPSVTAFLAQGTGVLQETAGAPVWTASPSLANPTATTLNGNTFTTGTGTLTLGAGKTTTFNHTSTFTTTDGQTYTFPTTTSTVARTDTGQTFNGSNITSIAAGSTDLGTTNYAWYYNVGTPSTTSNLLRFAGAISSDIYFGRVVNADTFGWGVVGAAPKMTYVPSTGALAVTGPFTSPGIADSATANIITISSAGRTTIAPSTTLTGTTQYGVIINPTFTSTGTTAGNALYVSAGLAAASFTQTTMRGLFVDDASLGASSAVTNQFGIQVSEQTKGSTLNAGYSGTVSSGTGKWNLYMSGTASNALVGNVRIGSTVAPTVALDVTGDVNVSSTLSASGLITATKGSATGITVGDVSTNSNSVLRMQGTNTGYNWQFANNLNVGGLELTPSTATGGITYTTPVWSLTQPGLLTITGTGITTTGSVNAATQIKLNGVVVSSATAPTYASGGCSTQSAVTSNGTAAFSIQMTGTCTGSQPIVFTLPAAAHSWACHARDITTATNAPKQTGAASTTSVTITNYVITTGVAGAWTTNDVVEVACLAY